jgi:signal transduction histidine kinase
MSHELRTPLNAIILYSELLQEEAQDKKQLGTIGDLSRIHSAGSHSSRSSTTSSTCRRSKPAR